MQNVRNRAQAWVENNHKLRIGDQRNRDRHSVIQIVRSGKKYVLVNKGKSSTIGSNMAKVRRATHAGSWYTDDGRELSNQLGEWLSKANPTHSPARAIIAPHAGYYYCGACGGHAYRQIDPTNIKRVFILGPSHHVRLTGCALTTTDHYQTPLYDLIIDHKINEDLMASRAFEKMKLRTDEDEHSIEMHLPYVAKVMERKRGQFTIIPVLVGSLSAEKEQMYGSIFSKYLADPENLFVISSDFCHWGQRFRYTFHDRSCGEIWQSIEALDRMGMDAIEQMDPGKFAQYLKEYENTICGRYPIGVLLNAVDVLRRNGNGLRMSFKFTNYAQSSRCKKMSDSSVSYAAGVLVMQ